MESHPLVYIRTDGNETIATGHLMRCLSIARALKKRGAAVAFLVSDDTSASILQKMYSPDEIADHSFPILELRTDYRSLDREIQTMQGILSSHNVACLLVDSYFATPEYLDILRQICKVAYLDDLQAFDCPASLVINYDFCVDESFYTKADCVLTGCAYTPLREQLSLIHISEPTRLGMISYAVFCLKKKKLTLIHISEPTRRTPISYDVFCLKTKKKKKNREEIERLDG